MHEQNINQHVLSIIADYYGVNPESIDPEEPLERIPGFDCFNLVSLVVAIEIALKTRFDHVDVQHTKTLRDIVRHIERKIPPYLIA